MYIAYCYVSGEIYFGDKIPEGALPIVAGKKSEVAQLIEARARHGQGDSEGVCLVPGVPEAKTETSAVDALIEFIRFCRNGNEDRPMLFGAAIEAKQEPVS